MGRAFAMMPEVPEVRVSHALSLALQGRFDEAETIAAVLVADPHSGQLGQRTLAHLARLRAAAKGQAPQDDPPVRTISRKTRPPGDGG